LHWESQRSFVTSSLTAVVGSSYLQAEGVAPSDYDDRKDFYLCGEVGCGGATSIAAAPLRAGESDVERLRDGANTCLTLQMI
jgi:hypothetical protein